jgi:hypothetical protein
VAENDPWNIRVDLQDGIDSAAHFTGADGNIVPQRRVLHELIVQIVSERKILSYGRSFDGAINNVVDQARSLASYKVLEQSGDYNSEKISSVLDEMGLDRLPLHARAEQVMMVTGGAGTGKSSLVSTLAAEKPDIYQNAVQINPDNYKDLLARPFEYRAQHASYTHWESSMIADEIMGRLDARMAAGLDAPHVLMDITAPHENRMAFAKRFDQMTVIHGTAPAEVTVERVYNRGFTNGEVTGRVLPTEIVLDSTANSSKLLPNVFEHPNLDFTMLNTDVPFGAPATLVATWDNEARLLSVHDPDRFIDFVQRQEINTKANAPEKLYDGADHSPQKLAERLQPYTDKGVQIDFLDADKMPAISISREGAKIHADVPSARGSGFMHDLAEHCGRLGKNGGVVAGLAFGGLSGAFTLAAGGDSAQAAAAVYESAVPYGETQIDLVGGDMEAAGRSATIETVSNLGSGGGALAGAAIGTAILPGIGTVVGAGVGAIAVGIASGAATEFIYDHASDLADFFGGDKDRLLERLPTDIGEEAPPELQHLVEIKRMLAQVEDERKAIGSDENAELDQRTEHIKQMFDEAYDTYEKNGSLESAKVSLENWERAGLLAQQAIESMKKDTSGAAVQSSQKSEPPVYASPMAL